MRRYLEEVAGILREGGLNVRALVTGSGPARTIVAVGESEGVDLIMLATHGRGGLDRWFVGSVADRVVRQTRRPVFLVPIRERRKPPFDGRLRAEITEPLDEAGEREHPSLMSPSSSLSTVPETQQQDGTRQEE